MMTYNGRLYADKRHWWRVCVDCHAPQPDGGETPEGAATGLGAKPCHSCGGSLFAWMPVGQRV